MDVKISTGKYQVWARKDNQSFKKCLEAITFCNSNVEFMKRKIIEYVAKNPGLKKEYVIRIPVGKRHHRIVAIYLEFESFSQNILLTNLKKAGYRKAYVPFKDNPPPYGSTKENELNNN